MENGFDHPIQTIMSRTGSFPTRVACSLLQKYARHPCVVFDPFCGKGTSLLAARLLGCPAYGMDIAPEAVICSTAKLADVSLGSMSQYIATLPSNGADSMRPVPASVHVFFHRDTLTQILAARSRILRDIESNSSQKRHHAGLALSALLGILHGHASYSLSVSSAHAYSMAPRYVATYAARHGLKAPAVNVKACLLVKLARCLALPLPPPVRSDARRGSALECTSVFPELIGKVDVILTSPPYLNAQTYAKDNWLRLWLLGYDYKTIQHEYLQTGSVERYGEQMRQVFHQLALMLKPGGRLICVAGDVARKSSPNSRPKQRIFKTGEFLRRLCALQTNAVHVNARESHIVPSSLKYLHALSRSNGHSGRDLIERVFVVEKT